MLLFLAQLAVMQLASAVPPADWLAALEMIYRRYEEQNVVTTKDNP